MLISLCKIQGAIILDSILHFNDTVDSQNLGRDWSRLVPESVDIIEKNQSTTVYSFFDFLFVHFCNRLVLEKGDFLALIQRQNEGDFLLANKLRSKWRKNRSKRSTKYKLLDFKLQIGEVGCWLSIKKYLF